MSVTEDVTATLRAEMGGHPPVILVYDARGNGGVEYVLPLQETIRRRYQTTQQ